MSYLQRFPEFSRALPLEKSWPDCPAEPGFVTASFRGSKQHPRRSFPSLWFLFG